MTTGIPFEPKKDDVIDAIKRHKGIIRYVAKEYNVHHQTIYNYMDQYPEFEELLTKIRGKVEEDDLDLAESVNRYMMTQYKEKPGYALKASHYLLDRKGHKRGYNTKNIEENADYKKSLGDFVAEFTKSTEGLSSNSQSDLENKQSL